jgi:aldose 1-epimerase
MAPSGIAELPPSGVQFTIANGRQQAVVTEVGATLRSYTNGGEDVIDGFEVGEMASAGRGQVLAPWPNRLGDGRYSFDGRDGRAALDEPERRNAIHGLVRWMPWQMVSRMQNIVSLACVVHAQPAYPWRLELCVEFRLGRDGLTVSTEATNTSAVPAPFGVGFHPYLTVGTTTIDPTRFLLPARRRLVADERGLPTGDAPLAGTEFDFSSGRPLGSTRLDTAYTQLERDAEGTARVELDDPRTGRGVTLWVDEHFPYLMAYTGDTLEPAARRRGAVAVEPMSCPPDALRSGQDLVRLEPEATWRGRWGITPRSPRPPQADDEAAISGSQPSGSSGSENR